MTCDVLSGILQIRTLRLPDALSRVTQQFMTAQRLRTRICAEGLRAEAECRRGVREILGNVMEGVLGRVRVDGEGTSLAEITVVERGRWRDGGRMGSPVTEEAWGRRAWEGPLPGCGRPGLVSLCGRGHSRKWAPACAFSHLPPNPSALG